MPNRDRFDFAPTCVLASLAVVEPVGDGRWRATDDGGLVSFLSDADFRDRCVLVTGGDASGVYSVIAPAEIERPRRFVLDAREKTVAIEGFEVDMRLDEFRRMAVRATAAGKPIVSLAASLAGQWEGCRQAGLDGEDHLLDIREMSGCYGQSDQEDELYDHHMYNLVSSEQDDGKSYPELLATIMAAGHRDGPVHQRFGLTSAFDDWREVRALPPFMQAQVRVAFDMFMRKLLGDYPQDRVSMACAGGEQLSERLEEAGFDLAGMLPPFEGGNMLPGYRTGDVALHRARGVDVIVFTDFLGTYAYAWPTDEGGKFEPPADQMRLMGLGR